MAQFDAKKYAEMSGGDKKKADKKDKKPAQQKKETPKKKEEKKEDKPAEPAADAPAKKAKSPFEQFPAPENWIWDEWKKIYSNEHWDSSKMSAWFGDYNEDFQAMDFMNVNLIGGM